MRSLVVGLLVLSSVASLAQANPAPAGPKSACGPNSEDFKVTAMAPSVPQPSPKPDEALVYVIEEENSAPGCFKCQITTKVGVDGGWVGANHGNSFFSFTVTPGEHHFCTSWQSRFASRANHASLASLNAEAGKIYYFRTHVLVLQANDAYNVQELQLARVDPDEGQLLIASSRQSASAKKH